MANFLKDKYAVKKTLRLRVNMLKFNDKRSMAIEESSFLLLLNPGKLLPFSINLCGKVKCYAVASNYVVSLHGIKVAG